ncbi:MAG: ABC transporter permease subunit [Actinomycetota bacterium]|nr:ABC transporter permease subunit [Actinomycetota bacterium]
MNRLKVGLMILIPFILLLLVLRYIAGYMPGEARNLPFFAFCSFSRMLVAYVFSFIFAIAYGYASATRKWAEKTLLPALDILQSVPVLGFFPVAVLLFISVFRGERFGIELASIFLIFTSQAWNMAFGVYESIITIPKDLRRASAAYGLRGWLRFKRLFLPACVPKLIYNSMMSWAGGWYFLMACEIISLGCIRHRLPGLGSFLLLSSAKGRFDLILWGLMVLILIIVALDTLVWRPLSLWANKFTYQMTATGETAPQSPLFSLYKDIIIFLRLNYIEIKFLKLVEIIDRPIKKLYSRLKGWTFWRSLVKGVKAMALIPICGGAIYIAYWVTIGLMNIFSRPFPAEAKLIPLAILASFARLSAAYILCLAWTIPMAVLIGKNERLSRVLTPLIQIAASIPATALFPLIVIVVIHYLWGGMDLASILLVLTGMQWYVLFNLLAGVRSIPADLDQAVKSFGVSGWNYWKRLILPAIFPSLITGSITGWGGGWNALIVSEYLFFRGKTHTAFGIGMLLDKATYEMGDSLMILLSLTGMILTIVIMNRFVWRRLYEKAATKYVIEF